MNQSPLIAAQLAALSPAAFARKKPNSARRRVSALNDRRGDRKIATDIWAAEPTLRYIRDYVARTLKRA